MKNKILNIIKLNKTKILTLSSITSDLIESGINYKDNRQLQELKKSIEELIDEGVLEPLKTARPLPFMGMLLNKYRILIRENGKNDNILVEVRNLNKKLSIGHYLKNPSDLQEDMRYIKKISMLLNDIGSDIEIGVNERSYELFNDEKAIEVPSKAHVDGSKILKRLGLSNKDILAKKDPEPFAYYKNSDFFSEDKINKILIVENKEAFWTAKRSIESNVINDIDMVIYGHGNAITARLEYALDIGCKINDDYMYWGDIDKEGAAIYIVLKETYPDFNLTIALEYYEKMLRFAKETPYVGTKKGRNFRNVKIDKFIDEFQGVDKELIRRLITEESGHIPQEVINLKSLRRSRVDENNNK